MRRRSIVLLFVLALTLSFTLAWRTIGEASALTTSYTKLVPERESFAVDLYETVRGYLSYRSIAERLISGKQGHRERLSALMLWAHENVRPQFAAPGRVVADNFIDISRRGHGYCDQAAHVFATLAHFAGYEVHLLFLRAPNGDSPHTVAEVLVDGRWVLVDAWLGTMILDHDGQLVGTADLRTAAGVPDGYAQIGIIIDESYFERGTPFVSFPYQDAAGFGAKVWSKIAAKPIIDTPDDSARRIAARPAGEAPGLRPEAGAPVDITAEMLKMDAARWAHLEGRYSEAIDGYRWLLGRPLPQDMAESVPFFLGLALLRDDRPGEAIAVFDAALDTTPETEWAPSLLYYRAETRLQVGDVSGAMQDLQAADVPPASRRLAELQAP